MISAALLSADRGRVLVSRLLSFARRQHLETKVVDLRELVSGMSALIARSVGADIALEMETSQEVPLVEIDPNQLELALLHLSVNARDDLPDGGTLRIGVTRDRKSVAPGKRVADRVVFGVDLNFN